MSDEISYEARLTSRRLFLMIQSPIFSKTIQVPDGQPH